jgi:hypothetical protein
MSDEELKLTRRFFLQQTAFATAMAGGFYCISQKTDALEVEPFALRETGGDQGMPYPYAAP